MLYKRKCGTIDILNASVVLCKWWTVWATVQTWPNHGRAYHQHIVISRPPGVSTRTVIRSDRDEREETLVDQRGGRNEFAQGLGTADRRRPPGPRPVAQKLVHGGCRVVEIPPHPPRRLAARHFRRQASHHPPVPAQAAACPLLIGKPFSAMKVQVRRKGATLQV